MSAAALFLFAHQDDEFGVFAEIERRAREGEVTCAYFTDGAAAGDPARRDAESLAVLRRLGVAAERVHFFGVKHGIADGRLCESLPTVAARVAALLDELPADARVFVSAWEGGHQDHDGLHAVTATLLHERGRIAQLRQFPLYNAARCVGPFFRVLSPLAENGPVEGLRLSWGERLRQLRHCWRYPSQWRTWLGLFPFVLLHMLLRGRQSLQAVDPARLAQRPHAGRLFYERRGLSSWQRMQEQLAALRGGR
ncbi:MAG: PIG-L family deacetylase [Planctomycetes bacterium]|nr:PIG-L family deacetylase [Planctomycetota bacterium]